jgi:ketosteroid isomerase-like protein
MTTQAVADQLVALCRAGKFDEAYRLFHEDAVALEPTGSPNPEVKGLRNLLGKAKQWNEMVEEHYGQEVSDPIVAENFFCVSMVIDNKLKGFPRMKMEELCVYEVHDGKIVKEQFFYTPTMPS